MNLVVKRETQIHRDVAVRKEKGLHAFSPGHDHLAVLVVQIDSAFQPLETHRQKMPAVRGNECCPVSAGNVLSETGKLQSPGRTLS